MGLPRLDDTVKIKGLPFRASPSDVVAFFEGFKCDVNSVYMRRHSDGRPNGEVRAT